MTSDPFSPQEETSTVRLDSWKEIAAYLGRGERTAKRWESERALPVHRLPGGGRGSVYAFAAELDEWLISARPEEPKPDELGAAGAADASSEFVQESESGQEPDAADTPAWPSRPEPKPIDQSTSPTAVAVHSSSGRIRLLVLLPVALALVAISVVKLRTVSTHSSNASHAMAQPVTSAAEQQRAQELYLNGRFEWSKRTPDSLNRALDDFTQALVHDPGNAQIYVGLADTYNMLREYSLMPENEAYNRAIAASRKAVELDDSLAEAHRSLAFDEFWGEWNFQAGAKEFRRAIELNPRDPLAHLWFANAFTGPGWYPACLREIDRAQKLDPTSPVILAGKGKMLFDSGQAQPGIELLKLVERTDPEFLAPHRYLAGIYFTRREYPGFLMESQKTADLNHDPVLEAITAAARQGFQRSGEPGLLRALYVIQKKCYTDGNYPGTYLAKTCMLLGKKEEALQLLRADYARHSAAFIAIRGDQILSGLKGEPAYWELIKDLQFPAPDTGASADLLNPAPAETKAKQSQK
jgi:tetratricopeptide (TPR) repeat protein